MTETAQTTAPSGRPVGGPALRWLNWPLVIPVLLGVLFALGDTAVAASGLIDLASYEFWLRLVVFLALFVGGFEVAYRLLVMRPAQRRAAEAALPPEARAALAARREHRWLSFGWKPAPVALGALVVLACWLPYLVCLYPGTIWYDTSWQIYEHFSGSLSDHHPFMLVYLYGLFVEMGRSLFGSAPAGMFVLIAIQDLAAAVGISLVCSYLRRAGARWGWCLAVLLFFGLFPLFPMMMGSMVKDTLQATLLIYFCLVFCEVVRTRGELLRKTWPIVCLLVLGFLICVSKKTGTYVVGPALVCLAFLKLRHGGRALMPIMGAFLMAVLLVVFPRLVLPALNVEPGGKQEMLAVPIQQVAHDVKYHPDYFTDEDKQLLNDFLWIDYADIPSEYDYTIVDPIKDGSLRDESLIPQFMQLWAHLVATDPHAMLEGWLGMEAGWISTEESLVVKVATGEMANADTYADKASWDSSGPLNDYATQAYNLGKDIPVVNALYSTALWATVLPFFALYCIWKTRGARAWGRWASMLLCAPYLFNMATLFICPVSTDVEAPRYLMPMVTLAPLFVTLAVLEARDRLAGALGEPQDDGAADDAAVAGSAAVAVPAAANGSTAASEPAAVTGTPAPAAAAETMEPSGAPTPSSAAPTTSAPADAHGARGTSRAS